MNNSQYSLVPDHEGPLRVNLRVYLLDGLEYLGVGLAAAEGLPLRGRLDGLDEAAGTGKELAVADGEGAVHVGGLCDRKEAVCSSHFTPGCNLT